ncbi:hypothetical protein SAMN00120144_0702 [Hymenobacter roseosalivarius DSM 11622]|uniref:Glycosyltransferase RgtA/B/C/D-like domain-containing protein n=1 Tax=Hymenobacter roseosalivarius DSM 11622 TaxID=645990 RepID=A0A1W1UQS4_9BACT|nr:hypothetical protein [Hymenobacter roseosalivarius]SMB83452.1 hypothetical protein SAMN00120144_0702 [Hymenobacter roseosalivarius DSM 11622]
MLRFFKSPLSTRLITLLILVLAVRLPLLWLGVPLTATELRALLIGERMHAGALLYRDLYDSTAPLSALVFATLDLVASRPLWLYRILALALLLFQALRLNLVLNRADVHPERGYVAALTYLLVASVTAEVDTLSPLLLGHTFIVTALSALLPTTREGYDNRRLFRAGFLTGLAALCYLPLALFLLVGLFAVIIFAANSFRSFLLLLCGFFFPYIVVATFFLYTESLPGFVQFHLRPTLQGLVAGTDGLPLWVQLRLLILPGFVLLLALGRAFTTSLGLVFQVKFRQMMLVWLLAAGLMMAAGGGVAPGTLVLALPPLAYFGLFLWQKAPRPWVPDVLLLVVLEGVLLTRYRAVLGLDQLVNIPAESRYAIQPHPAYKAIRGQRLLVLGPDRRPYVQNSLASPYLDWRLAQADFGHLNEYAAIFRLAQNFAPQPPTYLIDEVGLLPELRYKLPAIFGRYQPTSTPRLYRLR